MFCLCIFGARHLTRDSIHNTDGTNPYCDGVLESLYQWVTHPRDDGAFELQFTDDAVFEAYTPSFLGGKSADFRHDIEEMVEWTETI